MHYWMLPALPWLITLQWSRVLLQASLQPLPNPGGQPSATIIPFPPRAKRAVSA